MIALTVLLALLACSGGQPPEDAVVVRLGNRTIELHEIEDWVRALGINYPTWEAAQADRFNRMNKLIVDECLILGAYEAGLANDGEIRILVEREEGKFLIDALYDTQIKDKVRIDPREISRWYDKFFTRIRPRQIVMKTRAGADSILTRLRAGEDFAELARRYSIDRSTAPRGGDMGRGFRFGELAEPIRELLFTMEHLEVGGPVQSDFGWHVMQVLERRDIPKKDPEVINPVIEKALRQEAEEKVRAEQMAEMRRRTRIAIRTDALGFLQWVVQSLPPDSNVRANVYRPLVVDSIPPDMRDTALATYGSSGRLTLGRFIEALNNRAPQGHPDLTDTTALQRIVFELGMYDILYEEARRLGLHNREEYKEQVLDLKEDLMRDKFLKQVLPRGLSITEDRAHRFWEENPDSFATDTEYALHEVQLKTEEEAVSALRSLRGGNVTIETLAREGTLRAGFQDNAGDLGWVGPRHYPPLYAAAAGLAPGEFAGPILTARRFSVIRLDSVKPGVVMPYEQVRSVIYDELTQSAIEERQGRLVDSLKATLGCTIDTVALYSMIREDEIGEEFWGKAYYQHLKDSAGIE